MKTTTLIVLCILNLFSAFSQDKKFGITAQLSTPSYDDINIGWYNIDGESIDEYNLKRSSYSMGLIGNYQITEDVHIRLRLGYTRIGILEYSNYNLTGVNFDESMDGNQNKLHIAPGGYWPVKFKKISFYGGFEIPINLHGAFTADYNYVQTDISTNDIIYQEQSTLVLPRGYSVGLGAIFGFNIKAVDWFSIGAEFSPSMLYARLSGETNWSDSNGASFNTQDENKGFGFYDQRFSLNLSLWL